MVFITKILFDSFPHLSGHFVLIISLFTFANLKNPLILYFTHSHILSHNSKIRKPKSDSKSKSKSKSNFVVSAVTCSALYVCVFENYWL